RRRRGNTGPGNVAADGAVFQRQRSQHIVDASAEGGAESRNAATALSNVAADGAAIQSQSSERIGQSAARPGAIAAADGSVRTNRTGVHGQRAAIVYSAADRIGIRAAGD